MKTKIISAFPGTGKSVYHSKHKETTLDSEETMDKRTTHWVPCEQV